MSTNPVSRLCRVGGLRRRKFSRWATREVAVRAGGSPEPDPVVQRLEPTRCPDGARECNR